MTAWHWSHWWKSLWTLFWRVKLFVAADYFHIWSPQLYVELMWT